jgi:Tol biopolymer transport system component
MAAKSMIYIIDKYGFKVDSIERIGEEVWHPRVTDDGKYLAYIYGRAYPDGEEGKVVQHFVIYDIEKRNEIYKLSNFVMRGGQLIANGNYFMFSKSSEEQGKFFRIICDPEKKVFYKKLINNDLRIDNNIKWGFFGDQGIYDKENKSKLISTWKEDFQVIPFDKYN